MFFFKSQNHGARRQDWEKKQVSLLFFLEGMKIVGEISTGCVHLAQSWKVKIKMGSNHISLGEIGGRASHIKLYQPNLFFFSPITCHIIHPCL